jgi:hypothetical protein
MFLPGGKGSLTIEQIPRPNLGLTPTEVVAQESGSAALEWLGRAESDFEREAVLDGPDPGRLVPATNIAITIERDGIRVRANSAGRSLVVVPFEYSRCWAASPHNGTAAPELRRADFLLMGLLFEGNLDTRLQYRLAPFRQQFCRLTDFNDHLSMLRDVNFHAATR